MKISAHEVEPQSATKQRWLPIPIAVGVLTLWACIPSYGQAPGLLWTTNIAATLFAVDAETNAYANVGGSVIKLSPNGVPLQTNSICPIPGMAQRDATGNFYFAGNFDGTQDFGGITLVGGWTNWPTPGNWTPGYPTHYVAKYASNGSLLWVTSFGEQGGINLRVTDFLLDLNGGSLVGHVGASGIAKITRVNSAGTLQWTKSSGLGPSQATKVGGLTSSNICYFRYDGTGGPILGARLDYSGNAVGIGSGAYLTLVQTSNDETAAHPVIDDQARLFLIGRTNSQQVLCKFTPAGPLAWVRPIPPSLKWTLARDAMASVYCGATDGALVKYDVDGNEIWATNYQSNKVTRMLVDVSGNRFLGFTNGAIARLGAEASQVPPSIVADPQVQISGLGGDATFSVAASGSPALVYHWRKDGESLGVASATNYTITGLTTNHIGDYDVVVTNLFGSVTSAPAALLISPSILSPFSGTVGIWGRETILSVSAWGSGTLTYQWYKSGQLVDGATNSTLEFSSLQFSNSGLYSVVISSSYGSVTNTPAQLVVNPANISLNLYAGITIDGTVGYTYGIEYTTNLQDPNAWQSLTNVTLSQPVELWVDTSVPATANPKRYYRVTGQ